MKKSKRLLSLIMALTLFVSVLFSFSATPFYAADATSGTCGKNGTINWVYNTQTKVLSFTGSGEMKDFGIFGSSVAPWKAYRDKCTTVTIGSGITTIGEHAFYEMTAMTSITLPSTLTSIKKRAFENSTALQHINLNEGLLTIEQAAFKGCTALQEIVFPDSLTAVNSYPAYGAFQNCTALETVVFGEGITSTGPYTFYQAGVKNVTFSSTITTVENWCFFKCQMTEVSIPENITTLETRCFADCTQLLNAYVYNSECDYQGVIGEDPFNGTQQILTFHGHSLSTTQTYAEEKGYQFVSLDDCAHAETHQEITLEPTCTTDGSANVICDVCEQQIDTVVLPATGHDYIDNGEAVDNTELNGHIETPQICTVCGDESIKYEHQAWVDGYNHSTTTATCQRAGLTTTTCDLCGQTRILPALKTDHNVEQYTQYVAPTCTEAGSKTGPCTMCGEVVTVEVPATGHQEEKTVNEVTTDGHQNCTYTCTVCGETRNVTEHINWTEGYYTEDVISAVSCTSNGQTERTCTVCGYQEIITTRMTGHDIDYESGGEVTQEPTCTKTGTKTYTCANCGGTVNVPIAALGHEYLEENRVVLREPTCTTSGTGADVCTRCALQSAYEIPALGHDIADSADYNEVTAPTCTAEGSAEGTCSRCSEFVTVAIAATGHSFDTENAVQTKAPTCENEGKATATCTACGETETITLPATGHHYHYLCREESDLGTRIVYKCADCNDRDSSLVSLLVNSFPAYVASKVEDSRLSQVYRYDLDEDGYITMRDYAMLKEYS